MGTFTVALQLCYGYLKVANRSTSRRKLCLASRSAYRFLVRQGMDVRNRTEDPPDSRICPVAFPAKNLSPFRGHPTLFTTITEEPISGAH
jgi:hypothetical protein